MSWSGGEHLGLSAVGKIEGNAHAFGAADPVLLHQGALFRPAIHAVERGQQIVGVGGDAEEPLAELAPFDQGVRAPAAPINNLFVGEHGHVHRFPIDVGLLAIDEAGLVKSRNSFCWCL